MSEVRDFEGKVTQFLPGKRGGFVTLSEPIGEVRRAFFNERVQASGEFNLKNGVKGTMAIGEAIIAEVLGMEKNSSPTKTR